MQSAVLMIVALLSVSATSSADDLKISRLEQDLRTLQRQVQGLSRQIDELQRQSPRTGNRPKVLPAPAAAPPSADTWLDAAKWRRLKPGMSELEVIGSLGPPTSMRDDNADRVLLYAMEIGPSGFLGGSVRMRDRAVVEVQTPVLQ
jgi:hypothetical protein